MKRVLGVLLLVCVFALASVAQSGGGTHETGGAQPTPTPPECENCLPPDGGGTNAVTPSDGSLVVLIVDGAVFIYSLL